jgi:hypothetical protein
MQAMKAGRFFPLQDFAAALNLLLATQNKNSNFLFKTS